MENNKQRTKNEEKLEALKVALYCMIKQNIKDEFINIIANEYTSTFNYLYDKPTQFTSFNLGELNNEK